MKSFVIRLSLAAALTLSLLALAQPSHAQETGSQAPAETTPPDQPTPSVQDQQSPAAAPPDTTQSSPSQSSPTAQSPETQSPQTQAPQNDEQMPAAGDDAQTPSAQAFTGRIMKEDGKIVLKDPVTKNSYQIDDTAKAKPFMGKQVKVTGKLDMNSNTIHIETIAPLS